MARVKNLKITDLVDVALADCIERGPLGTNLTRIAERAGIDRGSLTYHFGTLDAILAAVRERMMEPLRVLMNQAAAERGLKGLRFYMGAFLEHWAKHPQERKFYLAGMHSLLETKEWWPQMNIVVASYVDWYEAMLDRAIKDGDLLRHDTRSRAVTIFCALEGAVLYIQTAKTFDKKKVARRLEIVLLGDVLKKG